MYYIVVLLKNWSECHGISCEDTILDSLAPTAYVGWLSCGKVTSLHKISQSTHISIQLELYYTD